LFAQIWRDDERAMTRRFRRWWGNYPTTNTQ